MPKILALARSALAGVLGFGLLMGLAVGAVFLNARLAPALPLFPLAVVPMVVGATAWLARRAPLGLSAGRLPAARSWALTLAVIVLGVAACVVQGAFTGFVREPELGPPGVSPGFGLAYAVTLSAAPAVLAEVVFRGYLQGRWTALVGTWPAILGVAALNTVAHRWGPELADQWVGYFIGLAALGYLRAASGSLWPPLGAHLLANVALAVAHVRFGAFDHGAIGAAALAGWVLAAVLAGTAAVLLGRLAPIPPRQEDQRVGASAR
jgi:membrane protease YdiL (CAAX protease family)